MTDRLFCFGLGYSAQALLPTLKAAGWRIGGTTRTPDRLAALSAQGVTLWRFGPDHPLPAAALDGVTHVLSSIPPDGSGDPVLNQCRDLLVGARDRLRWVGYLSSTGVYGDTKGALVDETGATNPSSEHARRRASAERRWRELPLPVHVFRLAGIYGAGRSALDSVLAGTARRLDKPGHVFSRIHVEDVAAVLAASMARPNPGAIYNVCDDETAPAADVIAFAADLLGVERPPLVPIEAAALSPMAASFWADNRRVDNRRIHDELGVTLTYPTFREGLQAIHAKNLP